MPYILDEDAEALKARFISRSCPTISEKSFMLGNIMWDPKYLTKYRHELSRIHRDSYMRYEYGQYGYFIKKYFPWLLDQYHLLRSGGCELEGQGRRAPKASLY